MVNLDKANAVLQVIVNPQATPQEPLPRPHLRPVQKPVSKPNKVPKSVTTNNSGPRSQANLRNYVAEKERRAYVEKFIADQKEIQKQTDVAMKRMVEDATEKLKKLAEYIADNTHLMARDYRVHEATGRVTVKIYDSVTGEIIREVPGVEFLDRVHKMEELMGVIFDKLI